MSAKGECLSLKDVIAAHLSEWDEPHVELDIYGSRDPSLIAERIESACLRALNAAVARPIFYQSSIGAVAGLELDDGRRVVFKAHQSHRSESLLREVARIQAAVSDSLGIAPAVLAGPFVFGSGFATIERYVDVGVWGDPHRSPMRAALARSFHSLIASLLPYVGESALPEHFLPSDPDALWPRPHSKLFDFEATREGAGDIDDVARAARSNMFPAGRVVIAHGDWRAEHVRFDCEVPVVAYDWDSLCKSHEPAVVGFAAHAFCADWSRADHIQAPSIDEAAAFVREYEAARQVPFTRDELRLCSACFAYSVAYTARCRHALHIDERGRPGTFQYLITLHGVELVTALH